VSPRLLASLAFAVLAAFWDLRARRCPNALTYGAAAAGLVLGGWPSLVACAACTAALPLLRPRWAIGAGDMKMLGALGALCPTVGVPVTLIVSVTARVSLGWRTGVSVLRWTACLALCLELR
jgi:Flp pilus assembly protein protease CpaA